ncbi:SRPBCC family protein [Pseudotenacibaculum haliotis]|uniref:SRPBCC domain-containing protein n=1 Tax=Pseudotenacibaculum haliotis TaxID=1862138 RepID=A0ABW5LZX5_9FLAO
MNTNKTITIKRTLNAPIASVWAAWKTPEHIAKWWNPTGGETRIVEHSFTKNGSWKYAMLMPNNNEFIAEGSYTEIIPLEKIASIANFHPMTIGICIESVFKELGTKTELNFHIIHPTEEYKTQQENKGVAKGWNAVFDRLEVFLNETDLPM